MTFDELYTLASNKAVYRMLGKQTTAGYVGAAPLTDSGNVYTGVNIDAPCSVDFCAEHSAIAAMISDKCRRKPCYQNGCGKLQGRNLAALRKMQGISCSD